MQQVPQILFVTSHLFQKVINISYLFYAAVGIWETENDVNKFLTLTFHCVKFFKFVLILCLLCVQISFLETNSNLFYHRSGKISDMKPQLGNLKLPNKLKYQKTVT